MNQSTKRTTRRARRERDLVSYFFVFLSELLVAAAVLSSIP